MILAAIIACEIGFWVAIIAGLTARYVFRRPRLGGVLLIVAPLIDLLLLVLVAVDLLGGATASWHHGLAALYIGISVAYGHRMIAWADARFARRFSGEVRVLKPKFYGTQYAAACWRDLGATTIAVGIAGGLLWGLAALVGVPERTAELRGFFPILGLIFMIDLVWAVSYSIWPRRAPVAVR